MKLLQKTLMISAMSMACASSFAQSSSAGIDPTGEGVIHIDGTAVGSCTAPTIPVDLGAKDFSVAKNGATGVYEHLVDIAIVCTNPNQTWSILPQIISFSITGGSSHTLDLSLGANYNTVVDAEQLNFVSLTNPSVAPGTLFADAGTAVLIQGTGTQTVSGKLTLGADLNENATWDNGAVPTGTITARGSVSVDIPLQIMY